MRVVTSHIGQPMPRHEDDRLLRGEGQFVDDLHTEGLLHARFVRSTIAHGTITRLGVQEAAEVDSVVTVLTAADLELAELTPPIDTPGAVQIGRPILAEHRVRFVGEPVAVVIARDAYAAEDAAELVDIEIDPLDVVTDPTDSDPPALLHEPSNVLYEGHFSHGAVDEAFTGADIVLERRLRSPRQTGLPIEPRGMMVEPNEDGLQVHASTQSPHMLRRAISELLGLSTEEIRVRCPDIGGGFGLKAHVYPEEIAVAAAARWVNRPVKWTEDRADNLAAACHARDQHITVRVAAQADGRLRALDADVTCDVGAYGVYAHGHLLEAMGTPSMIPGPYRLDTYRFRSRAVATNKCPEGAYRGVGLPVATFVHERVMDLIANATGIDQAEVRRRNLIRPDELPYRSVTGQTYDGGDYPAALETALKAIGYRDFAARQQDAFRSGRRIGLGLAAYVEHTAVNSTVFRGRGMRGLSGFDEAHVTLDASGQARVWTTLPSIGQGLTTTFAQMTADELGLPIEAVTVEAVDTGIGDLDGNGTFASRSAVSGGGAIATTCDELVRRLKDDAAARLEIAADDLRITDGQVQVVGSPQHTIDIAALTAAAPDRYQVSRRFDPPTVVYPYGVHACIIEIDDVAGQVRLERYVVAEDCGRVINPLVADGQVRGAVVQGLAGALFESFDYDESGQPQTTSLMDYLVPTAGEFVPVEIHHLEVPAHDAPHGAKGVGESGTLAPGAAVANAVGNALEVDCDSLPVRPEWIRAAAREEIPA